MAKKSQPGIGFGAPATPDSTENTEGNTGKRGRPENLKPWQPGQSGNPGGRPKKKPFTFAIAQRIDANPQEIADAVDHLMELAKGNVGFCEGGPAVSAFKLLKETIEGKAVQPLSGPDGGPIQFVDMTDADLDARIQQLISETGTSGTVAREGAETGTEAAQQ